MKCDFFRNPALLNVYFQFRVGANFQILRRFFKLAERSVAAAISPARPEREAKALNFHQSFVNYFFGFVCDTRTINGSQSETFTLAWMFFLKLN